ncbi:MAG: hypothetical protein FVQ83_13960 [Chloroflexi bacterium]|nr:hypothetical protein [Chloroflexota bacterium]
MDIQSFKCPNCGANLKHQPHEAVIQCSYCDSSVIVPNLLRQDSNDSPREISASLLSSQQPEKLEKLKELVAQNRKTKAIHVYRELYDAGYSEASQAVDRLMQEGNVPVAEVQDIANALDLEKLAEMGRLIAEGRKIDAIKLFREVSGVGLKEAKDTVEKMARGESVILRHTSVTSSQTDLSGGTFQPDAFEQTTDLKAINELLLQGKKIDGIKMYRQVYGVGLKDAKEAIEKISTPMGKAPAKARLSCIVSLILTLLLALLPIIIIVKTLPNSPIAFFLSRLNPFPSFAKVVNTFDIQGIGENNWANQIATGFDGNIYVLEWEGRVQVFDPAGAYISEWSPVVDFVPAGLAVDTEGIVYLIHSALIFKYDGITGESLGEYSYDGGWGFEDVAISADGSLVTVWDDDIVLFDNRGNVVLTIPEAVQSVSGDSELTTLVTTDGMNNIYALGVFNDAVFKFNSDGNFVTRYGSSGDDQGQFRGLTARAIAVDNQDRVYVAAYWGIEVFAPDGTSLARIVVNGVVRDLAINEQNDLFVLAGDKVYQYKLQDE